MSDISTYSVRFPARGNTHRVRDVDYYINEWGDPDAPLIVFLHGWGDSGATFQFVVDELAHELRANSAGRTDNGDVEVIRE